MRPRKTTCGAAPAGRRVTGEIGTGLGSEVRRASGAIAASRLRISSPSATTTSARVSVAAMTRRSGAGARSWKRWKRPRVHVQHHRHPQHVREPGQRGLAHEAAGGRHVDVHQIGPAQHHLGRVAPEAAGEGQRLGRRRAVAVRGDVPDTPPLPEPRRRQRPHAGGDATLGGHAGGDPRGCAGDDPVTGPPRGRPRPRVEPAALPASSRGCASYQAETSSGVIPPGSPASGRARAGGEPVGVEAVELAHDHARVGGTGSCWRSRGRAGRR